MTANAGYHLFTTGDVLTASQVQYNLQNQTIMYFASSAARTSALSGVLVEGMFSYLADTDSTEYYSGSAWTSISNPGDITAVTAGTGISGGGTSGAVTVTNSMATAITTNGDLIYGTGSGTFNRLGAGSTAQGLAIVAGIPAWSPTATSALTTTGDLLYASGANTLARRGIGTTGQVLTVAGGLPTWASSASGSLTLLGSTALSGLTTYTFSSISQSYKNLYLVMVNATYSTSDTVSMNLNGVANNAAGACYNTLVSGTTVASATANNWVLGSMTASSQKMNCALTIYEYANTSSNPKQIVSWNNTCTTSGASPGTSVNQNRFGVWQSSTAGGYDGIINITSLKLTTAQGSFNSGDLYLYGVN